MKSVRRINIPGLCFTGALVASLPSGAQAQANVPPSDLTGSLGIHDPSTIIKQNGTYFLWGTRGGGMMSKDRKNWTKNNAGNPAPSQSWWAVHGGEQWAPDAAYMNGKYYYYYSVSAWYNFNSAIGVTWNPTLNPTESNYKWTDIGMVIDSAQAQNGGPKRVNVIDPGTIQDADGKWYLVFGSFQGGVRMIELNPATGLAMQNPPRPTVISTQAGEGSACIRVGNYYYYAISEGKCCAGMSSTYHITYGRATSIKGPYTTRSGGLMSANKTELLMQGSNNSKATSGEVAVGVGGFFWDGSAGTDTLFLDFMAYTAPGGGAQLHIVPLYQDAQG